MNFLLAAAFQMMYKFTNLRMFFQKGSAKEYWDMQTKPRTKKKRERTRVTQMLEMQRAWI